MAKIELDTTLKSVDANWHERVLVLWQEDECLRSDPTAEHVADAWERYTRTPWDKRGAPIAKYDGGDCSYALFRYGWVVIYSFDGDSIGRLVKVDEAALCDVALEKIAVTYDAKAAACPDPAFAKVHAAMATFLRDHKGWTGDFGPPGNRVHA